MTAQTILRAHAIGLAAILAVALTPDTTRAQIRTTVSAGYGGGGPTGVVMLRAEADVAITPQLRAGASVASLDHGNAVCTHQIPSECDGGATVYAAHLGYELVADRRSIPGVFIRAGALRHDFSGIGSGSMVFVEARKRMGVSVDGGVRATIRGPLAVQVAGTGIHVFNADDYADAVGRRLRYALLSVGVSFDW
jgi:hypothetical protein